jgi:hypothetical protein
MKNEKTPSIFTPEGKNTEGVFLFYTIQKPKTKPQKSHFHFPLNISLSFSIFATQKWIHKIIIYKLRIEKKIWSIKARKKSIEF